MSKMTAEEYEKYVQQKTPNSPIFKNCIKAFLIGGLICLIGQGISDFFTKYMGLDKEISSTCTSVVLVFLGALLTGLDIYPKIAKHAGAGTIVPITGFANSVVSPALESKSEGLVLGTGAKIFTIAGPVILYGVLTSWICGMIYYWFI